jgi:chromosome segregation ATPase
MELHRADREKQGLESHLSSLRRDQGNELARNTSLQKTLEEIKTEIPECQELIRGANQKKVEMIALRDRAKEDLNSDSNRIKYLNQQIDKSYLLKQQLADIEESFEKFTKYASKPLVAGSSIDPGTVQQEEADIIGEILAASDYQ